MRRNLRLCVSGPYPKSGLLRVTVTCPPSHLHLISCANDSASHQCDGSLFIKKHQLTFDVVVGYKVLTSGFLKSFLLLYYKLEYIRNKIVVVAFNDLCIFSIFILNVLS